MSGINTRVGLVGLLIAFLLGWLCFHRCPYLANWPYTGIVAFLVSLLLQAVYKRCLKVTKDDCLSPRSLTQALRVFPIFLFSSLMFWSFVRATSERYYARAFKHGVVIEKYRSTNHSSPSIRVQTEAGIVECEDIPSESWDRILVGSSVSKLAGVTDVQLK